ncbi:anhydro-N-acetylmuramic acid kinase, partial [Micromonospora sp. KC207]|uniref:anhydro-N-acetylmuramic acid kinase n=1 Tax=Micromonospora sp. KC207 TaxID=2530377 RepID=UPI00352E60F2
MIAGGPSYTESVSRGPFLSDRADRPDGGRRVRPARGGRGGRRRRRGAQSDPVGQVGRAGAGPVAAAGERQAGVPSQAREAYAFALPGWLSWHGLPGAIPSVTGARKA